MNDTPEESALHWERLAIKQEDAAKWDAEHGLGDTSSHYSRAKLYRDTAKSIRIGSTTGIAHCACHIIPMTECAKLKR